MHCTAVVFVSVVMATVAAGCSDRSVSEIDPQQGRVEVIHLPLQVNLDLDLVFLIDDSPSMADKQANLADNFPRFIEALGAIPGGLPNLHLAVVSSDYGTKGAEDAAPGPAVGVGLGACQGSGQNARMLLSGVATNGDNFLSDVQDPTDPTRRIRNYNQDLASAFTQMAKIGAGGCGFEQPLEAIKQALQPGRPDSAGFLRPDAVLGVIIISDEDDCSMRHAALLGDAPDLGPLLSFRCTRFGVQCDQGGSTSAAMGQLGDKTGCRSDEDSPYLTKVADYARFLKDLKPGHPDRIVVAGMMGALAPVRVESRAIEGDAPGGPMYPQLGHSCAYVDRFGRAEVADPPIRLKFFLDQFPNRSMLTSICQADLSGGLQRIGQLLDTVTLDYPCIEGVLADVEPGTPGMQAECSVTQHSPGLEAEVLPACDGDTNRPCWRIETNARICTRTEHHFAVKIERNDDLERLPSATDVIASCVIE
jgi:hypothetical protein